MHDDVDFAEDLYLRINDAEQLQQAAAMLYSYWEGNDSRRARRYARAAGIEDQEQADFAD